jgi:hypothetical protein
MESEKRLNQANLMRNVAKETETIYLLTLQFERFKARENMQFECLTKLEGVLNGLDRSLDNAKGERYDKGFQMLKDLGDVYFNLGCIYSQEMLYRLKCGQYEAQIMQLTEKITALESELNALDNIK